MFLPSENEWYKAAYYNPGNSSYYQYPTSSNAVPNESGPIATPNSANYHNAVGSQTDVGAYTGTTSPYGAFDMGGNIFQWNEALVTDSLRCLRGGSFGNTSGALLSSILSNSSPSTESGDFGFRVASVAGVPEPSSIVLAALGLLGLVAWGWRRRKRLGPS